MEAANGISTDLTLKVREVVGENSEIELNDAVGNGDDLFAAGLQSLHCVRVLLALEDEFDIEIPQDKIDRELFSTVNNLAAAVAAETSSS